MYNNSSTDVFCEMLVSHKRGTKENLQIGLAILAGVVLSVLIFMTAPILFILLIPIWALVIFIVKMQKVEYEYIFTSGDLDIDALIGNFKRKNKMSLSMDEMTLIAPVNSHDLDGYMNNPNYHHYDFSANDAMQTDYIIIGNQNNQQFSVKLTPNERLLDAMFKISPGKVRRR